MFETNYERASTVVWVVSVFIIALLIVFTQVKEFTVDVIKEVPSVCAVCPPCASCPSCTPIERIIERQIACPTPKCYCRTMGNWSV